MSKSSQPQYVRVNPFARASASAQPGPTPEGEPAAPPPAPPPPPPPAPPTKAELDALSVAVRRRVTRLAIVFVGVCLLLVAGEIWITQELLTRQRSAVDQNAAIIADQTRGFRNSLNVAEMQLKQMVLDAQIHRRSLDTIASNAQLAYAIVLSNNITVAGVSRATLGTAKSVEADALAVRDARRNAQQIEIEFNLALSRIRKDYLTLSSNLFAAFEADLKARSALLDNRVKEAETLLASVKSSATEAEKVRKSIEASLTALRSLPAPQAPPPAPTTPPVQPVTPPVIPAPSFTPSPTPTPAPKATAPIAPPAAPTPAPTQPAPKAVAPAAPPSTAPAPAPAPAKN